MYEHKHDPLITAAKFKRRLVHHASIAMGIVTGSLAMGVIGFHFLSDLAWIDALLNAAMLLGGMGPVGDLQDWSAAGKIFASFYALYSGIIFLIVAGLLFAPVFHRFLHRFHLELTDKKTKKS
jgi:hypothetical protein